MSDGLGTSQTPPQGSAATPASMLVSGTATAGIDASVIVAGGYTVILTLFGDTWVAA